MQSDKQRQCYDEVFREQMEWVLVGFVLLDLWFCFIEHWFFCACSFGHCIVCPSSIYAF